MAQGLTLRKRPYSLELAENDQRELKRPKLLNELRVYAEDSEMMLCRTEATLALLRREVEQRAQLFRHDISDLRAGSNGLVKSLVANHLPVQSSIPEQSLVPLGFEEFSPSPFRALNHPSDLVDPIEPKSINPMGLPSLNGMMAMNKMMDLQNSSSSLGRTPPSSIRERDGFHKMKPVQLGNPQTPKTTNSFQKARIRSHPDDEDSDSYSAGRENTFAASPANEKDSVLRKRSRLPPNSVAIFRNWLFNHLDSPYPSEDEKEELALKAGLRITQVNNWFTNARRRILPREDGDAQSRARALSNADLF